MKPQRDIPQWIEYLGAALGGIALAVLAAVFI